MMFATLAAASLGLAIVTQDATPLRAAPAGATTTQAMLAPGDLLEVRGERLDHLQVYDHQPGLGALFGMIMAIPALHDMAWRHGERVSESVATALASYAPRADSADVRSVAHTIPVLCHELLASATINPKVDRQRLLIDMRVCLMALATRLLLPAS